MWKRRRMKRQATISFVGTKERRNNSWKGEEKRVFGFAWIEERDKIYGLALWERKEQLSFWQMEPLRRKDWRFLF